MMFFWNFKAENSANRSYYFRKSSFKCKLKKWWFQKWPNTAKFFDWRFQPFGAEASTWENWLVWSLPNSRLDKIFVFIILVFFQISAKIRKNGNFTFCDRKVAPVQFILSALQTSAPYLTKMQKKMFKI